MNAFWLPGDRTGETSAEIRERVVAARKRQHVRFKDKPKITWNARMRAFEIYTTHHSYRRHQKDKVFFHHKPFPLEIKTLGDLLMVRRKQAGFTHKQLAAKTGVRLHWIRRFEFDRCLPPQPEWDSLRKFLKLPPTPILTFTQPETPLHRPKSIGEHLRKRRLELKLCLAEAASRMGVSVPTLGLWELGKVFPKHCYHGGITAFLGYDLFS